MSSLAGSHVIKDASHLATAFSFIGMPLASCAAGMRRHRYDERAHPVSDNAAIVAELNLIATFDQRRRQHPL